MSKRELIDRIRDLNPSAQADFLASFSETDLRDYLHQLSELEREHAGQGKPEPVLTVC